MILQIIFISRQVKSSESKVLHQKVKYLLAFHSCHSKVHQLLPFVHHVALRVHPSVHTCPSRVHRRLTLSIRLHHVSTWKSIIEYVVYPGFLVLPSQLGHVSSPGLVVVAHMGDCLLFFRRGILDRCWAAVLPILGVAGGDFLGSVLILLVFDCCVSSWLCMSLCFSRRIKMKMRVEDELLSNYSVWFN